MRFIIENTVATDSIEQAAAEARRYFRDDVDIVVSTLNVGVIRVPDNSYDDRVVAGLGSIEGFASLSRSAEPPVWAP